MRPVPSGAALLHGDGAGGALFEQEAPRGARNVDLMTSLRHLWAAARAAALGRSGVTAAEYAILAVGIVIVVGGAVVIIGDPLFGALARAGQALLAGQADLNTPAGR